MKWHQLLLSGIKDMKGVPLPRARAASRRRVCIPVAVAFIAITVLWAYLYPPQDYTYPVRDWFPSEPARELTDEETAARVVFRQILSTPPFPSRNPKIAFMFLTPGKLPFENLWELFFKGHEGRYTIYVHASREKPEHVSPTFVGRDIHSDKEYTIEEDTMASEYVDIYPVETIEFMNLVAFSELVIIYDGYSWDKGQSNRKWVGWGMISMVDAERRLLAKALEDIDNQHFVLLSDSCVPLHNFDYVYDFLMGSKHSFLDCFDDPGPHGAFRYSKNMLPEVRETEFRKGSQWFSIKRQHAMVVTADSLYYKKFRHYCKPGMEEGRNCYADEHYLPTLFHMMDPAGIANWSVTYVDWSEGKWHPRSFRAKDVTYELLKNMTSIDVSYHVTSDEKKELLQRPCLWNGLKRPCYLFARKFYPEALNNLMNLFSNYTIF